MEATLSLIIIGLYIFSLCIIKLGESALALAWIHVIKERIHLSFFFLYIFLLFYDHCSLQCTCLLLTNIDKNIFKLICSTQHKIKKIQNCFFSIKKVLCSIINLLLHKVIFLNPGTNRHCFQSRKQSIIRGLIIMFWDWHFCPCKDLPWSTSARAELPVSEHDNRSS